MATYHNLEEQQGYLRAIADVNIILTGKTGNGKSSTGNSILRSRQFVSKSSTTSVTNCVQVGRGDFKDKKLKVVDCPGVGDTRMGTEQAMDLMMTSLKFAIEGNLQGYDALILVVKFGERFTKEDQETVRLLKSLLGQEFIRQFGILILSCGDYFEREQEETRKTFRDWCAQQEGEFKKLLGECQNRVVLFNNVTKDKQKQNDQVESLINVIESCRVSRKRYTNVEFGLAKPTREKLYVEVRKEATMREFNAEIQKVLRKKLSISFEADLEKKNTFLRTLKGEAATLLHNIEIRDRNTGVLNDLLGSGRALVNSIQEDIQIVCRMKQEQARMAVEEAERQRQMEENHRRHLEEQARLHADKVAAVNLALWQARNNDDDDGCTVL